MAITFRLPAAKWYHENTNQWTLDYPPFFAWFEYLIGLVLSPFCDPLLFEITNNHQLTFNNLVLLRLTVVLSEVFYYFAALRIVKTLRLENSIVQALLVCNPGLLLVDHIHFQYNGFLYGFLILSIDYFLKNKYLKGAISYAILLNFKHIYLYHAPAYFVFLLSNYCFVNHQFSSKRFVLLASCVTSVFFIAWFPFKDHIMQILSRLFPFKRGLTHAYWAPNIWALYCFADRFLVWISKRVGLVLGSDKGSLTKGIVGDVIFQVLPQIHPSTTFILTLTTQIPILWLLWKHPTVSNFINSLIISGYCSFMFGYHVHEKAILIVMIPMTLLYLKSPIHSRIFGVVSCAGTFGLFPLLFKPEEQVIKVLVLVLFSLVLNNSNISAWSVLESGYLFGFIPVYLFMQVDLVGLEFLPLMICSVYSSLGIVYGFLSFYQLALMKPEG